MKEKRIVRTREELNNAKKNGVKTIIVVGELANNLMIAKKITTIGPVALGILTTMLAAVTVTTPMTGGLASTIAVPTVIVPIATASGVSMEVITATILAGGVTLICAIFKDYDIEWKHTDKLGQVKCQYPYRKQ